MEIISPEGAIKLQILITDYVLQIMDEHGSRMESVQHGWPMKKLSVGRKSPWETSDHEHE